MSGRIQALWLVAGGVLLVALLLPWWDQTCDDGCVTGETGLVQVTLAGTWRGVFSIVLIVGLAVAALLRNRIGGVFGVLAAAAVLSMLVSRPHYSTAAPYYFNRHFGWYLAIAGIALSALALIAQLAKRSRPSAGRAPALPSP